MSEPTPLQQKTMTDKLFWDDIEKVYQTLSGSKPDKLYYVLTEYLTDKTEIYVAEFPDFGRIRVMHPDKFQEFEAWTTAAGYQLVDFRTVDPLPPMRRTLMIKDERTNTSTEENPTD